MSLDITSNLLLRGVTDPASLAETLREAGVSDDIVNNADAFKSLLNAETAKLVTSETDTSGGASASESELEELIDSLDKSILGTVASSLNTKEAAAELLTGEGADEVINELVSGHMNAIVMTDSDDAEDMDDAIESSVTEAFTDSTAETLAENLETIMEHLNQLGEG